MDTALLVVAIVVALGFDFTNGFHDTANAVATSISTRALSPRVAVAVASVANLIGALVGAAMAQSWTKGVQWHGLAHKVVIPAFLAPTIAFATAFVLLIAIF